MEKSSTKKSIFQEGLRLFREKGYENVSIKEICEAAGATRNAFYYHYTSKEELLASYLDYLSPTDSGLLEGVLKQPNDWQKLLYIYEFHTNVFLKEGADFVRQLIVACIMSNRDIMNQYELSSTLCIPLIEQCKKNGFISSPLAAEDLDYYASRIFYTSIIEWSISENKAIDLSSCILRRITDLLRPELRAASVNQPK